MELRELRSFNTAANLRSISRAAEVLGIGQPTVSTHIKETGKGDGGETLRQGQETHRADAFGRGVGATGRTTRRRNRRAGQECRRSRRSGSRQHRLHPRHHLPHTVQGGRGLPPDPSPQPPEHQVRTRGRGAWHGRGRRGRRRTCADSGQVPPISTSCHCSLPSASSSRRLATLFSKSR